MSAACVTFRAEAFVFFKKKKKTEQNEQQTMMGVGVFRVWFFVRFFQKTRKKSDQRHPGQALVLTVFIQHS